jgi:hypothetical protein
MIMKAIVKATGEIVEVHTHDDADFQDRQGRFYWEHQLYFGSLDVRYDIPDYWTRLEHQYAGMAMQGMMSGWWSESIANIAKSDKEHFDILVHKANELAHALVEKLKEKEERK